ncbi:hypothetical protein AMD27_05720 [Acinetobacter sp. TGL-Y2]|nr:hypothetical protein AMD27_05720 [Acinetobacter sp. TGL-Y2]
MVVYQGQTLSLKKIHNDIVMLCFDRKNTRINKLDKRTLLELHEALITLTDSENISGLLVMSNKNDFILGGDILEFPALMQLNTEDILSEVLEKNTILTAFESLPYPTLTAINGFALGGGVELSLTTDLRVIEQNAHLGFPEVTLGLIPGYGGTVRFPSVTNTKIAIDMMASGRNVGAEQALEYGLVHKICEKNELLNCAYKILNDAIDGTIDWKLIRKSKQSALPVEKRINHAEYQSTLSKYKTKNAKDYPAASEVIKLIYDSMDLSYNDALIHESVKFSEIAKTQAATGLVQLFINNSKLKKNLNRSSSFVPIKKAGVVGAGIMGGGIVYVNARNGIDVTVYDISEKSLEECSNEFHRLMSKEVTKNKINKKKQSEVLNQFHKSKKLGAINQCEIVIEAVTEKLNIKHNVLKELETIVNHDCIFATNTSSLCLKDLVISLAHPERLIGLHFFNPVSQMDLVEVIKTPLTEAGIVEKAIQYVKDIKKTPIVVNDCAGFLVNRVLTPYMIAFLKLVRQGISIERIDSVMVDFGWPMGPALLQDVVGFDTLTHVLINIADAYPERMDSSHVAILEVAVSKGMLGAKNDNGFYVYANKKEKSLNPKMIVQPPQNNTYHLEDQDILHYLMLPMLLESVWCLEEKIVEYPYELDSAMVMGVGFPKYLGGPLKYIDWIGSNKIIELAKTYKIQHLIPDKLFQMASSKEKFHTI